MIFAENEKQKVILNENDEECDKMATILLNLAYNEKEVDKLEEKVEKFTKRYKVFDGKRR